MSDFLTALGLVLVIEGVLYALWPSVMRRMMEHMIAQPATVVRTAGLAGAALGVVIVWPVRG
ncbi:MAG: DUF2065 domain-containing protein [Alphaproteobacteria bacterium]